MFVIMAAVEKQMQGNFVLLEPFPASDKLKQLNFSAPISLKLDLPL